MSFVIFSSCGDSHDPIIDDNQHNIYDKKGYIKLYSKERGIELTSEKIYKSYLIDGSTREHIADMYVGHSDNDLSPDLNSITVYIDDNNELYKLSFIYSKKGSNWGSVYRYSPNNEDQKHLPSESTISIDNDSIIRGTFKGSLFDGVDTIVVDSCVFEFEK